MSKRVKKRKRAVAVSDPRSVEVLTVAWMLMVVTTLVCELGFAAIRMGRPAPDSRLTILSSLFLFAALVIGLLALLVTPVVLRSRRMPPPQGITVFAVVVGLAPVAMVALDLLRQ